MFFKLKTAHICIFAAFFAVICALFAIASAQTSYADGITEINLADYASLRWVDGNNCSLHDGTVYRYRYVCDNEWRDYYTTSAFDSAPDSEWELWTLNSVTVAPCSVEELRASGNHSVSIVIPSLTTGAYSVSYLGDFSAEKEGQYVAKAVISLKSPNYKFTFDLSTGTNVTGRGMSVAIDADGNATVTKIWYVARFENGFLDEAESLAAEQEIAYSVPDWTFGSFPSGGISAPRLVHGDEVKGLTDQPEGYRLTVEGFDGVVVEIEGGELKWNEQWRSGGYDIVTFTLKLNGETVCENMPRSKWGEYINKHSPSGSYTVQFTAKAVGLGVHSAWWSAGVNFGSAEDVEYSKFTREYCFEVYPAELKVNGVEINAQEYEINIENFSYSAFFGVIDGKYSFSEYIDKAEIEAGGTYWAKVADKYFDEAPQLVFNTPTMMSDEYLPADGDWSDFIGKSGEYTVYYRADMKNYVPQGDRYQEYFKVKLTGGTVVSDNPSGNGGNAALIAVTCVEGAIIVALAAAIVAVAVKNSRKS